MTFSMTSKIVMPPETLANEAGGESVMLNLKSHSHYGLDEVGTRMWTLLTRSQSIQVACEQLLKEYDVEEECLRSDLLNLITELVELGLIEVRHG
jgi:hypothetical protein